MEIQGFSLIGFGRGAAGGATWQATNPAAGEKLSPVFHSASSAELDGASRLASDAAPALAQSSGADRGKLLRAVASRLEGAAAELAARGNAETALPLARCNGEIGRTVGQLRLFAGVAETGDWCDARIETAQPDRKPVPKPDHRSMFRAIGPVVVFGASNFPFAFSTAGGDTASALAAGNPVVVKAHPAHPGTAELVGRCVVDAVRETGFPEGTFSVLFDVGYEIGAALVGHPAIKAVGFTGSRKGGLTLMEIAAKRPEPIPVFAEMSSVNPVFVMPQALAARSATIAGGLLQSVTMGVGQFCTNPGLVVLEASPGATEFIARLADGMGAAVAEPMLTSGIQAAYARGVAERSAEPGVRVIARGTKGGPGCAETALFATDAATFLGRPALAEEIFGPATLVVECRDRAEMHAVARHLKGSLTATIHADSGDDVAELAARLAERAGRVLFGGYPTGVEVSQAMVHGGPFPATSDARTTSVGSRAIHRFARLICYQGFPDALLPPELQNSNPGGLFRLVDGQFSRGPVIP